MGKNGGIAKYIDHTLLKPDASPDQIDRLCQEAIDHGFKSVCVNSSYVYQCAERLKWTGVKVCAVVGFPLGACLSPVKAAEAAAAVAAGAEEIDMVINIGWLKAHKLEKVRLDIWAVRQAVPRAVLKVIIETAMLSEDEKIYACRIAARAGADFVKTSTGFGGGGATAEDVALMRKAVGPNVGVKASGGIGSYHQAKTMIEAGANRLGCSSGVNIVSGEEAVDSDAY